MKNCDLKINDKKLKMFKPIIQKWFSVLSKYIKFEEGKEVPWYNERALISTLAAANWLCGYTALEEYVAKKSLGKKRGRREEKTGRVDLYLTNDNQSMECEAKYAYLNITTKNMNDVFSKWEEAINAAKELKSTKGQLRIAILFVSLTHSKHKSKEFNLNDYIECAKHAREKISCHMWAYYFANPKRIDCEIDNLVYPGVLLFAKAIGKGV